MHRHPPIFDEEQSRKWHSLITNVPEDERRTEIAPPLPLLLVHEVNSTEER